MYLPAEILRLTPLGHRAFKITLIWNSTGCVTSSIIVLYFCDITPDVTHTPPITVDSPKCSGYRLFLTDCISRKKYFKTSGNEVFRLGTLKWRGSGDYLQLVQMCTENRLLSKISASLIFTCEGRKMLLYILLDRVFTFWKLRESRLSSKKVFRI